MKKAIELLLFFIIVFSVYKFFSLKYYPCANPLTYKIGSIDPKFGLKKEEVLKNSEDAENLWEKAYGEELFNYLPEKGRITINFLYDERSELNTNINKQAGKIDNESSSLQAKVSKFNDDAAKFQAKVNDFNATVQMYNKHGGAPADVYDDLIRQQNELRSEAQELDRRSAELNLATTNYNLQVDSLNKNVDQFNKALLQKPEEGLYDPNDNSITIYFVNDRSELIHTIAHEFGHALGMPHSENTEAIMYPLTSKTLKVTDNDLSDLKNSCKEIPAYQYWAGIIRQKNILNNAVSGNSDGKN